MINSKDKGKRGERELAKLFRINGFENVRRGQQYNGKEGEDIVGVPFLHVECKFKEAVNIFDAYQQSVKDAHGTGKYPIVFSRRRYEPWTATMDFHLFSEMLSSYVNGKNAFSDVYMHTNSAMYFPHACLCSTKHTTFFEIYSAWLSEKGVDKLGQTIDS